jgi:Tol biopolymer transport system component
MILTLCLALLQEPTLQELLRDLGAEAIETRDKAQKALAAKGDAIEPELRKALENASSEAKGRVAALVRLIEGRRHGRILFNKADAIWACNFDGADAGEVFAKKSCALQGFSWSPDRAAFSFCSNKDGNYDVYRAALDLTADRMKVDVQRDYITRSAWSPDGKLIAFQVDGHTVGTGGVYVVGLDGGKARRLTAADGWDGRMSWSPKGDRLALAAQTKMEVRESGDVISVDRQSELEIVEVATGKRTRLTKIGSHIEEVAWSPDGGWIAFATVHEVFRIAPDGGDPKSVRKGRCERLSWSPDGKRLGILTMERPSVGGPDRKPAPPRDVVAVVPLEGAPVVIEGKGEIDDFDWSRCGAYLVRVEGKQLVRSAAGGGNEKVLVKELEFSAEVLWGGKR